MKDTQFPIIRDVDHVLANDTTGTLGGIQTIKPPAYLFEVSNPDENDASNAVIVPVQPGFGAA